MENIIIDQNPHWAGERYDNYIRRLVLADLLQLLTLEEIVVLKGVRRCGKTTLFFQMINHLMHKTDPQEILYINMDDPFFTALNEDPKNLYKIIQTAEKITNTKIQYLFLDEIQNMKQWQKFVKSVYDSKKFKKILITGSNSKLLDGKYATLLSGRYVEQSIYPLSYKECLLDIGIDSKIKLSNFKPKALSLFEKILYYGCFPRCYLESDEKLRQKILSSYYDTILLKDCIAANDIRDKRLMAKLAHYIISNVSARFSYTNIAKNMDSNEKTIKDYIHALEHSFLLSETTQFSYSLNKQAKGNKKAYCIDNGLVSAIGFQFDIIQGKLFENLVFNELKKCGAEEIFLFYKQKECDFIVKIKSQCIAIQVCHSITEKSHSREIEGLQLGIQASSATRGYIITYDDEKIINDEIEIIPFWKLFGLINNISDLV